MKYETPEQCYDDFWKEIVENEDGSINLDQIKKELSDFSVLMEKFRHVVCEISGNKLSKCTYTASVILDCYEEELEKRIKQEIDDLVECGELVRAETLPEIY